MPPDVAPARIPALRAWIRVLPCALLVAALGASAGPARADVPTTDANDTPDTAQGPLSMGVTYTGATDSDEDDDWFTFAVGPGTQRVVVSVSQPARGTCTLPGDGAFAELYGPSADDSPSLADVSGAGTGAPQQITSTLAGPATYYVDVGTDCDPGAPWALRIDTAGAAAAPGGSAEPGSGSAPASGTAPGSSPGVALTPAQKAKACRRAKRSQTRWTATVAATRRDLRRARSPVTRRLARHLLALQRSTLEHVRARVKAAC